MFGGGQEVFLYGRDGAIGVVVDPLAAAGAPPALLELPLPPPLKTHQELVDVDDDAGGLRGAPLARTLQQAHAGAPLLRAGLRGADAHDALTHTETGKHTHRAHPRTALMWVESYKHRKPSEPACLRSSAPCFSSLIQYAIKALGAVHASLIVCAVLLGLSIDSNRGFTHSLWEEKHRIRRVQQKHTHRFTVREGCRHRSSFVLVLLPP